MITLAAPWALALLPLPFIVRLLVRPYREVRAGLAVPDVERIARLTGQQPGPGAVIPRGDRWQQILVACVWVLLVAALARPQWIEDAVTKSVPTRDLLLAVDLSGSMEAEDFTNEAGEKVARLAAVKQVLDGFLADREGDRVGLILFGNAPFVQVPFTQDLAVCRTLLDEAQVRMAGPKTMLGDAVGLAINVFEESEVERRVLILLTDGNDTGSRIPPREAAGIAADRGIVIHTIAMGDPTATGEDQLDEKSLQDMAEATGGVFSRANDRDELAKVYRRLEELDTRPVETLSHRPRRELFSWPVGAALLLVLGFHVLRLLLRPDLVIDRRILAGGVVVAAALAALLALLDDGRAARPHFLRPAWLLALVPAALVGWAVVRQRDPMRAWRRVADEHLLRHLVQGEDRLATLRPVHLLVALTVLGAIAASGPAWRRTPSPFAEEQATLMIVTEVTPGMKAEDVPPSRLERGAHKIDDLLALRQGARTGLVAYAGSAHLVLPLTRDARIVSDFAKELDPGIMPKPGEALGAALELAQEQLEAGGQAGSILLISDGIASGGPAALEAHADRGGSPVHVLAMASPAALDASSFEDEAASWVAVSADASDVEELAGRIESDVVAGASAEGRAWSDSGYWLVPVLLLLALMWFRRGWVVAHE